MKGGDQIDLHSEKTTPKKPSLIRIKCDHCILYFLWKPHLFQYTGIFESYGRPTSMC